ncbi:Flp family type IVb pilin [Novosphingobium album (ex Hu et al. 2023)]|uniref:Flp family type IVb pilin n=1 Tax=Novosphingobium album (ex Hu et al. 2023) TaxID=2930093 RepID=A0ABT0B3M1_9SPHN|nr:Flp family type IVb pilin [Novosphingobium album (ex Hu et al. 2023)]MCJ2179631.1 Flp family type IVb pilin [Novosphingobium album (ex Hu et al. 2023)]
MARLRRLSNILRDVRGASTVEYGIILAMIVLVMFVALQGVADETVGMWNDVSTKSSNAIGGQ